VPAPRVIVHAAVSLDGRIEGFQPDVGAYYELIPAWDEDVTLCGSETILAAEPEPDPPDAAPLADADPSDRRPLLAVIDSRGRVRSWSRLIASGHWRAALAVCSSTTPADHVDYLGRQNVDTLVAGGDRVDLEATLAALAERGMETVRIDAGPSLNGLALRAGVVDEVSLLVHPAIVGDGRSFVDGLDAAVGLRLVASDERGGGLVWLRYAVEGGSPAG
jgi:2,5-diamino-6-(ribosylamino)-4(3H)-pyrimidinone 5'-phosphate reductase